MDLYVDLELVQSQKVVLTPQMRQALEILRMTSQELFEYVEEQLEINPALEMLDSGDSYCEDSFSLMDELIDLENSLNMAGMQKMATEDENDSENFLYNYNCNEKLSLKEHLLLQLHTSNLDENQMCIGECLIDNIDENGYLTVALSEVSEFFNTNTVKIKKVLDIIQEFDPPGICARSLSECLLIQLRQCGAVDKDVAKVVENYLNELADEKFDIVAKNTGLSMQRVEEIYKTLKTLEPKPGREYYNSNNIKYIIPDIVIRRTSESFEVLLNEDSIPLVNINEYYRKIMDADISSEVKKFIINRIDSAVWLIKCIEQRKIIMKKAAEFIVSSQDEFFKSGIKYLKPGNLKAASEHVGVHESMMPGILEGKYLQCNWGIFDMKCFIC